MSYAYYMPSKRERLYASKAGNTHAIWSRVISESDEPSSVTDAAGEQLWLGVRQRAMSAKAKHGTSATCKRCNSCGHFAFECRNHLSLVPATVKGGQSIVPAPVHYQLTSDDNEQSAFNWATLFKRHEHGDEEHTEQPVKSTQSSQTSKKRKRSDENKADKRKHKKRR